MGSRSRRRAGEGERPPRPRPPPTTATRRATCSRCATSSAPARCASSRDLDAKPAASAEDRWQRRVEFLFERLAVRWEIAGLPLEGQKELLGRYRLAGSGERQQVRAALAEHLAKHHPDVEL